MTSPSPHQWMSGETWGPANTTRPETATPDNAEAVAAVGDSSGNRSSGHGVIDVPNMSDQGTHTAGSR